MGIIPKKPCFSIPIDPHWLIYVNYVTAQSLRKILYHAICNVICIPAWNVACLRSVRQNGDQKPRAKKAPQGLALLPRSSDGESIRWYKTFARCQLYVTRLARSEKSVAVTCRRCEAALSRPVNHDGKKQRRNFSSDKRDPPSARTTLGFSARRFFKIHYTLPPINKTRLIIFNRSEEPLKEQVV